MKHLVLVVCAAMASAQGIPIASAETCPAGPVLAGACSTAEPWTTQGGVARIVPFGGITGPAFGFPTDGLRWLILRSPSAASAGNFSIPAGGPAPLPFPPGTTGNLRLIFTVPIPLPGERAFISFDYNYADPECASDPLYNDCLTIDLVWNASPVQNLLYLDTYSSEMASPAVTPNELGLVTVPAGPCWPNLVPASREVAPQGAPKSIRAAIDPQLHGQVVSLEIHVADGGDNFFSGWVWLDAVRVSTGPLIPTIVITQPLGAGTPVWIENTLLVPGNDHLNLLSLDLCPQGVGLGPFLGLCFNDLNALLFQLSLPLGAAPFHFIANGTTTRFGPYSLPPFTCDALVLDVSGGILGARSTVFRGGAN